MFGICFVKVPPTTYVIHYKGGRIQREGPGLSFFYFSPVSTIVAVPLASADVPFVFNETTADFQAVTIQGQLTYRVTDAHRLAGLLDFSLGAGGGWASDDPEALKQRLVHATQILTRALAQRLPLRQVLTSSDAFVAEVMAGLAKNDGVAALGVQILGLTILSIKPTPEIARALEAEAREGLQRQADDAVYSRRNAAVEQERTIKENELRTEIAVEEKKRQIRETQMAAEIAVEEQRAALIDRRVVNERKDADSRAYALRAGLEPLKQTDWRTLMAITAGKMDAGSQIAWAFRDLAENAQKIGELNITPELLEKLTERKGK